MLTTEFETADISSVSPSSDGCILIFLYTLIFQRLTVRATNPLLEQFMKYVDKGCIQRTFAISIEISRLVEFGFSATSLCLSR